MKLVLDFSTTKIGYAVIDDTVVTYGEIAACYHKDATIRMESLLMKLRPLVKRYQIKTCVVEKPVIRHNPKMRKVDDRAAFVLIYSLGYCMAKLDLTPIFIEPSEWRSGLGIVNATRKDLKAAACQYVLEHYETSVESNDTAEAICIADYYLKGG